MRNGARISAIIPALNEEASIGRVLAEIPQWVDEVIVADNGSVDNTAEKARELGARVVLQPRRGYGSACLAAMAVLDEPDVVVFLDGDFSDHPEETFLLTDPIINGEADLTIGSRVLGSREPGALSPQACFGNWLSCKLIKFLWNVTFTDLGPFRAIRASSLQRLSMRDPDYGWTVEMQIKAAQHGLRCKEVPVSYRKRIGKSKVSGTLRGIVGAGTKILFTIGMSALKPGVDAPKAREKIIVFTRYPKPGATKTRLIPLLGPDGAARLHRDLVEKTVDKARRVAAHRDATTEIRFQGGSREAMEQWLGRGLVLREQPDGDLGQRMARAFQEAADEGFGRVVLVGTDIPELSSTILENALDGLQQNELVLGPALDGGYYLVGLRKPCDALFDGMPWGTDTVLEKTLRAAQSLGLSARLVSPRQDIDRPEDLGKVSEEMSIQVDFPNNRLGGELQPSISVIIPTLNEASYLAATLSPVLGKTGVEIIVVDGGSTDRTVAIAAAHRIRVIQGPRGKAAQMNLGAARAKGRILLFLHADTRLPEQWDRQVVTELEKKGVVAGAFSLRIAGQGRMLRLIEGLANFRSRRLQVPYGDQAIFLKARVFQQLGGFPDVAIMEDFELVRRVKKAGRVSTLAAAARTSARRWEAYGVLRTTVINQMIILFYFSGMSPQRLERWYKRGIECKQGASDSACAENR
jgi:rSAM/selenodomain-associated transferase 2/rSAM/selenodomain-associated transferase 1